MLTGEVWKGRFAQHCQVYQGASMSIDKAIENLRTVRLRGGIFGKTAMVCIILIIGVSAVAFKSTFWWLTLLLMFGLMGIVFYALKRSFDFAANNPYAAIMEGAQLLQHERIVHASKNQGIIPSSPSVAEAPYLPQGVTDALEHDPPKVDDVIDVVEEEEEPTPPKPAPGDTGGAQ
jgi:hypothetical protein